MTLYKKCQWMLTAMHTKLDIQVGSQSSSSPAVMLSALQEQQKIAKRLEVLPSTRQSFHGLATILAAKVCMHKARNKDVHC